MVITDQSKKNCLITNNLLRIILVRHLEYFKLLHVICLRVVLLFGYTNLFTLSCLITRHLNIFQRLCNILVVITPWFELINLFRAFITISVYLFL